MTDFAGTMSRWNTTCDGLLAPACGGRPRLQRSDALSSLVRPEWLLQSAKGSLLQLSDHQYLSLYLLRADEVLRIAAHNRVSIHHTSCIVLTRPLRKPQWRRLRPSMEFSPTPKVPS